MRLTQQDIAAQADRVYKLQSGGIVNAFIAQGDALDDLNDKYRDGLVSVDDMASAIQAFGDSAVQAMVALAQARDQIDSLVQNGIRTIEMAGLTADERNAYLRNEAERARAAIGVETDPEKIRDMVNRIIANSTEVFNSLTPEQQAANRADFIDGLNRLRDEAQARIDKLNTLIADNASTTMAEIGASLVETVRQMGNTADKQSASVDTFASAVTDFADAAANGVRVEINLEDRTVSAVGGI
jgi:sugar-specific transcriptional regulator TrmB